jgi:hypothetical protein
VFICVHLWLIIVLLGGLGALGGSVHDLIPPLFLSACSAVHLLFLFWSCFSWRLGGSSIALLFLAVQLF